MTRRPRAVRPNASFSPPPALFALCALAALKFSPLGIAADNPGEVFELPTVTVVGNTPLPGMGVPLKDVAANVQIFNSGDISRLREGDAARFLERNANSVSMNSAQGNENQKDFAFRGFSASPLLGTPQGVSVFQDGVRINESFGDVVNWDLLPQSAISSIQLIPGSNPVFGLNTLGGALALYTKSGAQHPGGAAEVSIGSWRRRATEFEYGGARGKLDYFVTANLSNDDGSAEHNPSRLRQFFGKLGFQDEKFDVDVSLTLADNSLQGTQTLPLSMLDNRRQAYTYPDQTDNRLAFLAAKGSLFLSKSVLLVGNAYWRHLRSANSSSNVNDAYGTADDDDAQTQRNEANNNRSQIDQMSSGAALQLTLDGPLGSLKNNLVAGLSADFGDTTFSQEESPANFTADRGTVDIGEAMPTANVDTRNRYLGVYVADTLNVSDHLALSVSGRYNHARISIADRSGKAPGLDGLHVFQRFNPAFGVAWTPVPAWTSYFSYSEGVRAPTPIELTCARADAPCSLPNLFLADPPLDMIVSRTLEAGMRGTLGKTAKWTAALYRTELSDDIQFINSGTSGNAGYFRNIGKTRRQGVELSTSADWGAFDLALRYSFTDATFRSEFSAHSPFNSEAAEDGGIAVSPGNRLPAIPRHSIKLRAGYEFTDRMVAGLNVMYFSDSFARGDENNVDANGRIPGYAVVNLDGQWRLRDRTTLALQVNNLFDRRYENFGLLGADFFTGPNRTFGPASGVAPANSQFRGLGAPRELRLTLRYRF